MPSSSERQRVEAATLTVTPDAPLARRDDAFGNTVHWFQVPDAHDRLLVEAQAVVLTRSSPEPVVTRSAAEQWAALEARDYRESMAEYLIPSAYVRWPEPVAAFVDSLELPGEAPLVEWLRELEQRVRGALQYEQGATGVDTPVETVAAERRGVCQDFAHLAIAACRRSGVAARYVSGWMFQPERESPGESHAWMEAYLPEAGWVESDPTHPGPLDDRYIRLAAGRDYADVAPLRGTYVGAPTERMTVTVEVRELEPAPEE